MGVVLAITTSVYFAFQDPCAGSYLFPGGSLGFVCPEVDVIANLRNSVWYEIMAVITLSVGGVFVGWLYEKIKNRKSTTNSSNL